MATQSLYAKIIGGGAILGVVTAALTAWGTYGWVTKDVYAQDHAQGTIEEELHRQEEDNEKQLALLNKILTAQAVNRDQWECDETDEELEEVEIELLNELSPVELVPLVRQKAKLTEVWDKLNCSRFTD